MSVEGEQKHGPARRVHAGPGRPVSGWERWRKATWTRSDIKRRALMTAVMLVGAAIYALCANIAYFGPSGDSKKAGCFDSGVREWVHDPSSLFADGDKLFSYYSGTKGRPLQSVEVSLKDRTYTCLPKGVTFFANGVPSWTTTFQEWNPTGEFDAPAQLDNGKFIFYTVYDEDESNIRDAIGVAEDTGTPTDPVWGDLGLVVESYNSLPTTPRAMDPTVLRDASNGKIYLVFGSHAGGIYSTELNPATKKLMTSPDVPETTQQPSRFTRLAQHMNPEGDESDIEAPYTYRSGEYFYLFANWGKCCSGTASTYKTVVGRSTSMSGPFVDKAGNEMVSGGGTVFLNAEDRYLGPGHAGIVQLDDGSHIFTFHFYDGNDNGISKLGVRKLTWGSDGWPLLGGHLVDQPPY